MLLVLFLAACGGGNDEAASEPDCPTNTPGQQATATTTVDPRCIERATEIETGTGDAEGSAWKGTITTNEGGPGFSGTTNGTFSVNVAADGVLTGSGTSHSTYSSAPPIDSQITVTGKRDGDTFRIALAHNPGTRIEVVTPISGTTAEAAIDLTGEMGTYSRGAVRLECQDCT